MISLSGQQSKFYTSKHLFQYTQPLHHFLCTKTINNDREKYTYKEGGQDLKLFVNGALV